MNLEKVVFGFFVLLAATLNFGFFIGDLGNPELHNSYELYAAVVVNLIATVLKFDEPRRRPAAGLRGTGVGLRLLRLRRRADPGGDRERRVAVGRRADGQHRVGRAAAGRDGVVPPPLEVGGSR
jgi:hypothetical protein